MFKREWFCSYREHPRLKRIIQSWDTAFKSGAENKAGVACRAPAGLGGLCFFHANPDSARALGQLGGRKNRRSAVDLQVPDNITAADICHVTVQAIRLLLSGDMHTTEASALAQLCNALYRFIPAADLEARVTTLEEQFVQEGIENSPRLSPTGSPPDGPRAAGARTETMQHASESIDEGPSALPCHGDGAESTSDGSLAAEEAL